MKKFIKKNKGITLVALVITIIILLILAGITISQLTGSGLFEKARLAEQKSKEAQEKENELLGDYFDKITQYVDGNREQISVDKEEYENLKSQVANLNEKLSGITFLKSDETKYGTQTTNVVPSTNTVTEVNSLVIERDGLYSVKARFGWGNATWVEGYMSLYLRKNGSNLDWDQRNGQQFNYTGLNANKIVFLKKGDIVTSSVAQDKYTAGTYQYNILEAMPIYYVD